jgi:hypothetical protein
MTAIRWIGEHSNKVSSFVRAVIYMAVALSWTHLNDAQIGTILLVVESALALFIESNTVSKVRMGERIVEVEAKVEAKAEQKADAKVAAIVTEMQSGTFRAPTL